MSVPVPIFNLGALVAPAATPLFDRMKREGRLAANGIEVPATPLDTNIVPQADDARGAVAGRSLAGLPAVPARSVPAAGPRTSSSGSARRRPPQRSRRAGTTSRGRSIATR